MVDKDHLSGLLSVELGASALIISTAVDSLRKNFGEENEEPITKLSISDAQVLLDEGQFPAGSMGPKVQSLIEANLSNQDMKCIICSPGNAINALRGESGTTIHQ